MLAACFSPSPPEGLPCGEGLTCPEGQTCDIVTNECGPPSEALSWRDDTAEDLALGSGDVTLEPQGFVSPAAYLTGTVRVSGYDGLQSGEPFEAVAAGTRTGVGVRRSLRIDYQSSSPPGLGIADPDSATVLIDGEIELEAAGNWRFQLTANDRGYLEIAPPGGDFERVTEDVNTGTIGTFVVSQPGWHRFRAAFEDAAQFLSYTLVYDPPNVNGNGFRDIPTDRLRARFDGIGEGLVVDGFEHANLVLLDGTVIDRTPLKDVALATNPFALPIGTGYTLRWSGQFLIDEPGDFTFAVASPGGHRLWIDGAGLLDEFAGDTTSTTAPVTLAAGWHDLVLDANKSGPAGTLSFTVETGPQFSGGPLPSDHLRPVVGRGARFVADQALTAVALPDGTGASGTRTLTLDIPGTFVTPRDLRAAIELTAGNLATVSLVIDPPVGANIPVVGVGELTGTTELVTEQLPLGSLGTGWAFIGTDTVADMLTGEITAAFITLVYDGGVAPFALSSRYESAVRELGDAVAFERVAWTVRGAADAIRVSLRTCDTMDCSAESYVEVANGTAPEVTPKRFAQYLVEIASDGDTSPALDAFELRYFVRGAN